jgi:hypothetical protein
MWHASTYVDMTVSVPRDSRLCSARSIAEQPSGSLTGIRTPQHDYSDPAVGPIDLFKPTRLSHVAGVSVGTDLPRPGRALELWHGPRPHPAGRRCVPRPHPGPRLPPTPPGRCSRAGPANPGSAHWPGRARVVRPARILGRVRGRQRGRAPGQDRGRRAEPTGRHAVRHRARDRHREGCSHGDEPMRALTLGMAVARPPGRRSTAGTSSSSQPDSDLDDRAGIRHGRGPVTDRSTIRTFTQNGQIGSE